MNEMVLMSEAEMWKLPMYVQEEVWAVAREKFQYHEPPNNILAAALHLLSHRDEDVRKLKSDIESTANQSILDKSNSQISELSTERFKLKSQLKKERAERGRRIKEASCEKRILM